MKRAGILLLVLGLLSAALLYYYYSARRPAIEVSAPPPDLLSLLPPDAPYILFADWEALRSSGFVARLLTVLPSPAEDPEYAAFVRATGFDYTRHLRRAAVAVRPTENSTSALAVAEGRFDRAKVTAYVTRSGKRTVENGVDVFLIPTGDPLKTLALTFLPERRIAVADGMSLASAVSPGSSAGLDPARQSRIARVAGSALFVVGKAESIPENLSTKGWASDQLMDVLRSIQWVTLVAQPQADQMYVALEAECDTPANARQLGWTLDGLRVLGRLAMSDPKSRAQMDPLLAALLDAVLRDGQVARTDQFVRVSLTLQPQILDRLQPPAHVPAKPPSRN